MDVKIVLNTLKSLSDRELAALTERPAHTEAERTARTMAQDVLDQRRRTRGMWAELLVDDDTASALAFINQAGKAEG